MIFYVFSITDSVTEDKDIDSNKANNLNEIMLDILGQDGVGQIGKKRSYDLMSIEEYEHPFVLLRRDLLSSPLNPKLVHEFCLDLAVNLLAAELVEDSDGSKRRNKKITEGILVIKATSSDLTILKLEQTRSIDMKTYAKHDSFSSDKNYFKACFVNNSSIYVIDKNIRAAKYWTEKFLKITPSKDDKENTKILISLLKKDKLLSDSIKERRKDIQNKVASIVLDRKYFDPEIVFSDFMEQSTYPNLPSEYSNFFSNETLSSLDYDFLIDKKPLHKYMKKTVPLSDYISIDVVDFQRQIDSLDISLEGERLYIVVDDKYLKEIRRYFLEEE